MKCIKALPGICLLAVLVGCASDPKAESVSYVGKGNKYYERGKPKEASIYYRRALQKNQKNAEAWYKLGLINYANGAVGEARLDFIRVADLAEESGRFDGTAEDAISRVADMDYFGYMRLPTDKFKFLRVDLDTRSNQLKKHYANTFDQYRVAGLAIFASVPSSNKADQRMSLAKQTLEEFRKADHLKPYDKNIGFPIFSVLALTGQTADAEAYANEMINRKTADDRIYDTLWDSYLKSGQQQKAEDVRKRQVANSPKDGMALTKLAYHYYMVRNQPQLQATISRLTSDLKTFPNAYMLVGDLHYVFTNLDAAIQSYQEGIKADAPNKAAYLKRIAEAYTLENKPEQSAKAVADLLKEFPNDTEAQAMDVSLKLNTAKPSEADKYINILQPLIAKTNPSEAEKITILHFNLGRAYALKGDAQSKDQARLHFQEAINAMNKPYIPAYLALSQLELERGENPQAADHAGVILSVAPLNITARLVRTMALSNMGEGDKARQELEAILKLQPDSRDARFQLARLNLIQKRYQEAEGQFAELQKAGDPRGLAGVIECRVQQGHLDQGIQILRGELAKNPTNTNYRNALATLVFQSGDYKGAANEFRQLIDQNPNADSKFREDWSLRLGEALRRAGDMDGALAAFRRAGEVEPKDTTPLLESAMLYDTIGKEDEARKIYEQILKIQPDNAVALNNMAFAKADAGTDLDRAQTFAERARQKAPTDPNIEDTLGLIYFKKDAVDPSIQTFTELVRKYPDNPTYHLHLAMALLKKGDRPQARRELDQAQRHSPSDREQAQIRDLRTKIG